MPEWSSRTDNVIDNGFGGSRGGQAINGAIPHITASTGNSLNFVANWNERSSHPTYHIDRNGRVTGVVHPERRPYSTYPYGDPDTVTFEIDNITAAPNWGVSDASVQACMETIRDHYRASPRYGNGVALNRVGVTQREFFIGWHSQYRNVECPGPTLMGELQWIVDQLNDGPTTPNGEEEVDDMAYVYNAGGDVLLRTATGVTRIQTPAHAGILKDLTQRKRGAFTKVESELIDYYFTLATSLGEADRAKILKKLDAVSARL